MKLDSISFLTAKLIEFRDERDWAQYHNAKDLALALSIEAAELNELFLWKQPEEVKVAKLKEELADVLCYCLLLAEKYQLDVKQIIEDKITLNAQKYPVEKARGTAKKYNELD
ncbi:nucleotide pyrophosphohydrolase [Siphonobacter curvatus]|uniref:Nucleotide pyrophosphohydrolase n=1 Tax=Siphonobacter curvatus TaxID=2094562 RepID=A0A2S7II86_9BACT|nr:nucleotide pyrophosphohydrolase [Siphonobacter curvatus]PQA55655.1 nucleotide pyrophosphohydrolase [Siphonobacter curvatus]